MVLGLLNAQQAADQIWAFYQQVKMDQRENPLVGALWGLIDFAGSPHRRCATGAVH